MSVLEIGKELVALCQQGNDLKIPRIVAGPSWQELLECP